MMPRKPNQSPIVCEYSTWRVFRRDGVYYGDARGGKYDLGKHSLGTRDREQALEYLKLLDRKKAVELGLADARVLKPVEMLSIADGWKLYLDYSGRAGVLGGVSPATLKRYQAVRDKHTTYCAKRGIMTWNEFEKSSLEKYGNRLAKKHADRTVYFELTLLKSVNTWLVGEKKLPPEAKLEYALEKPQGTDTYCYRAAEVAAILAHCLANAKLVWLGRVVLALAHTGMRIGELTALRWSDVDLDHNVIRVADERSSRRKQRAASARTTKGRRSRTIPIHPRLKKLLVGMERRPDGRVFHAPRGGRLRPNNVLHAFINEVIQPMAKRFPTPAGEVGFKHGRLHSFRHYFCSQAFLGRASEGEIREWLGHRDSKMVEHYRHLRNEDAQRKLQQINFTSQEDSDTPPAGNT